LITLPHARSYGTRLLQTIVRGRKGDHAARIIIADEGQGEEKGRARASHPRSGLAPAALTLARGARPLPIPRTASRFSTAPRTAPLVHALFLSLSVALCAGRPAVTASALSVSLILYRDRRSLSFNQCSDCFHLPVRWWQDCQGSARQ